MASTYAALPPLQALAVAMEWTSLSAPGIPSAPEAFKNRLYGPSRVVHSACGGLKDQTMDRFASILAGMQRRGAAKWYAPKNATFFVFIQHAVATA